MALSEFVAMEAAYRALQPLDTAARNRALHWLTDALTIPEPLPEAGVVNVVGVAAAPAGPVPAAPEPGERGEERPERAEYEGPAGHEDEQESGPGGIVGERAPGGEAEAAEGEEAEGEEAEEEAVSPAEPPVTSRVGRRAAGSAGPGRGRRGRRTKAQAESADKERVYRRMPPAAEVLDAYHRVGTISGLAGYFQVPRHTVQGWARRLRRAGYEIGRGA